MALKDDKPDDERRDFLMLLAGAMGLVGGTAAMWPLFGSLAPVRSYDESAFVTVDLAAIPAGRSRTVVWKGRPVTVRHRTPEEIAQARAEDTGALRDPQTDRERTVRPEWLVVVSVCTHLGCIPAERGEGWFCSCHGSAFDASGRVVSGPAPANLAVPPYEFIGDTLLRIG